MTANPATTATAEQVGEWMREADHLDGVASDALTRSRLYRVRAGLALLAHDGDGDYSRATGLTTRQRKEARNFARAWTTWAGKGRVWPDDTAALPRDWADLSNRLIESRGLRGRSATAHNRGKVMVDGRWVSPPAALVTQADVAAPDAPRGVAVPVDLRYGVDVLDGLRSLPDGCVHCVVTSPPYWRVSEAEVNHDGAWGEEETAEEHLDKLVLAVCEIARVLVTEGVLWLNYAERRHGGQFLALPERLLALLAEHGWRLIARIVLQKSNPWHRPQNAVQGLIRTEWEPLYALTRDPMRRLDVNEALIDLPQKTLEQIRRAQERGVEEAEIRRLIGDPSGKKTVGDVWPMAQTRFGDHPCPFPEEIPRRCILLACPEGGTVLDPFSGSGTTGAAALANGRNYIGIDVQAAFLPTAVERVRRPATIRLAS